MSTRSYGRAFEIWVRNFLREDGWSVKLCGRRAVMLGPGRLVTAGDDILGCDILAIKPGQKTLFIQCTRDSGVSKRLEELRRHGWNLDHQQVELWQRTQPAGPVNIKVFTGHGLVDDRKIIRGTVYRIEEKQQEASCQEKH